MQQVIDATVSALRRVDRPRFFRSERAYQGELYCALREELHKAGVVNGDLLLEMEYQKTTDRHGMTQRPDIILHVPAEYHGAHVRENNVAVWALKKNASRNKACEDFDKLDDMFFRLGYPLGFFINITSDEPWTASYAGEYTDRLHAFAVQLHDGKVQIRSSLQDGKVQVL